MACISPSPSEQIRNWRAIGTLLDVARWACAAGRVRSTGNDTCQPRRIPSDYMPTAVYLTAASIDMATIAAEPPTATSTATATATFIRSD